MELIREIRGVVISLSQGIRYHANMWFLYLDESGDLGFDFVNKKPSKFFTITILAIEGVTNNRLLINAVKKTIHRKLFSKSLKRKEKEFNQYLFRQLEARIDPKVPFNIQHLDSRQHRALQAVDMFSWGFFQKYERQNSEWTNLFVSKVKFDQMYL